MVVPPLVLAPFKTLALLPLAIIICYKAGFWKFFYLLVFARTPDIQAVVTDSSYANFDKLVHSEFTPLTGLPEFFLPGMMMAGQMLWNIDTDQFWHSDDYVRHVRRVVTFLSGN